MAHATHYAAKCTPRKARLLRPLVMGKPIAQALAILSSERRAGSVATRKLILSALAQLPEEVRANATVQDFVVNEGPKRTTFMPRAQGRASPVIKRTSHLTVNLHVNGVGRDMHKRSPKKMKAAKISKAEMTLAEGKE